MLDAKQEFLMSYYGLDAECAAEILSELRDTQSLQSLTEPRAARAGGVQGQADHRP
jgi:hypothetical protein